MGQMDKSMHKVNDSPTLEFKPGKGLKQGDPLAPFLFIIVVEGLIGAVRQVVDKDMLQSVEVGTRRVKVNMLHYADDTLFFCKDSIQNIMVIKSLLFCFEMASGLKVNFPKSILGGMGITQSQMSMHASMLNCVIKNTPFTYLGMEVGGNHRRVRLWGIIIEKFRKRLDR